MALPDAHRTDTYKYSNDVQCQTSDCPNKGMIWTVYFTQIQPGLTSPPNVLCAECMVEPTIMRHSDRWDKRD